MQNDNDQVLGNILVLLRALDADGDPTNGMKIDAAANTAIAKAVTGGKTVNFNQAAAAFAADPVIVALLAELKRQLADAKAALLDFTELFPQSRSSSIALTSDNTRVVVANRQKSSVSVIRVRGANGADVEGAARRDHGRQGAALRRDQSGRQARVRDQRRRRHDVGDRPDRWRSRPWSARRSTSASSRAASR